MMIETTIKNLPHYKKYLEVLKAVEEFFEKKGYLKLDLPVLSPVLIPESYLEVFETEYRYLDNNKKLYLTPSPELFMKRLLVNGIGNCYYLGSSFRNSERRSSLHSSEFRMLEFYAVKSSYMDIAKVVLELLNSIAIKIYGKSEIIYQKRKVNTGKWEMIKVAEAFKKFSDINESELFDQDKFKKKAKKKGYSVEGYSYEDLFSQLYVQEVEPKLGISGMPTVIYDYPKEFAALAKLNKDGRTAQRFEFYISGIELGDCYSELTDWKEQDDRFNAEQNKRIKNGLITHSVDKGFIDTLKYGLGDCAGIAIGFERLAMIFANVTSIGQLKLINIE